MTRSLFSAAAWSGWAWALPSGKSAKRRGLAGLAGRAQVCPACRRWRRGSSVEYATVKGFKAIGGAGSVWTFEERIAARIIQRAAHDYQHGTSSQRHDAVRFFSSGWYAALADGLGVGHGVMPHGVGSGSSEAD